MFPFLGPHLREDGVPLANEAFTLVELPLPRKEHVHLSGLWDALALPPPVPYPGLFSASRNTSDVSYTEGFQLGCLQPESRILTEEPCAEQASMAEARMVTVALGRGRCQAPGRGSTFKASFSVASSSLLLFTPSRSASSFPFWRRTASMVGFSAW